jgi:hypothetical protein
LRTVDDASGAFSGLDRIPSFYGGLRNRRGWDLLSVRWVSDRLLNHILLRLFETVIVGHHLLQLVLRHLIDVFVLLEITEHLFFIVCIKC